MVLTKRQEIVDLISHELKTPTVPIIGYCEMLRNPKFGKINFDQEDAIKEIMNNINELQKFLDEIIQKQKGSATDDHLEILPKGLKTPLVPILGYCEMLSAKRLGELDEEQLEAVKEIQTNAIKLNHLINDFWNAQQIELGKMKYLFEDVNVTKFIEQMSDDFSKWMSRKNISFTQNIESDLEIKVDKSKLREIFENMIENAVVFVPENEGAIEVSAESKDDFVKFSVKDNGSGIPADKITTLFKKFHQLDTSHRRSHGGGGLGLTICKGYTEAMGGKLWVQSEEGKGTTFFFTIPKTGGKT